MPLSKQKSYISIEDYLAGERDSELRHEYINGDVYAMVGASRNHNIITFLLEGLLQCPVDLVTTEALSPFIGPYILDEAEDVVRTA